MARVNSPRALIQRVDESVQQHCRTLSLRNIVLVLFALMISACGGGQTRQGAQDTIAVSLSDYDNLVRHRETIRVTLTTTQPSTLGVNFSEDASGIDISVEDCTPVSDTCEVWAITPSTDTIPGRYFIDIRSSIPLFDGKGIALTVFPVLATAPALTLASEGGAGDTLVLLSDNTLVGWGSEQTNSRIDGFLQANFSARLPRRIATGLAADLPDGSFVQATNSNGADEYSALLHSDGTVWHWGESSRPGGPVAFGPSQIELRNVDTTLDRITAIATGRAHTLALRGNGSVWGWGRNKWGQLASEPDNFRQGWAEQVPMLQLTSAIAAGDTHSMALIFDGSVWAWGDNRSGQLGADPVTTEFSDVPILVTGLTDILALAGGPDHSLALHDDGTVWAWGDNGSGELGNGQSGGVSHVPAQIAGLSNIQSISAGGRGFHGGHNLALRNDGTVWGWGSNARGQLGIGGYGSPHSTVPVSPDVLSPVQIAGLADVSQIVASRDSGSYAITNECGGRVYVWGLTVSAGNGLIDTTVPTPVPGIGDLGDCGNIRRLMVYVSVARSRDREIASQSRVTINSDQGTLQCSGEGAGDNRICWQDLPLNSTVTLTATPNDNKTASWHWDCGDAGMPDANSNAMNGTVTMDDHKYCKVRLAANIPGPTAAFSATPNPGFVDANIVFDGRSSSGAITSYSWDFEDDGRFDASGFSVNHSYSTVGSYVVRLRVTDSQGQVDETTEAITVTSNTLSNTLTVHTTGIGAIVQASAGDGSRIINCGPLPTTNDCTEEIVAGNSVALNVFLPAGSSVNDVVWTGCDLEAGLEGCIINNMSTDRTITATFTSPTP